jgi:HAD superfamily hydrolase (TIGR01509 family)
LFLKTEETWPMAAYDLVIFDCDGVLIDSEIISAATFVEELEKSGIQLEKRVFFESMIGRSFEQALATVRDETGKSPPADFKETFRHALLDRFDQALKPIHGIIELLQSLSIKICVATSSDPIRAARSLANTGLGGFFNDRVFTASMVKNGKPAPDLFLFAASQIHTPPERCIVIEDSAYGLIAAKAAGMTAWHFTGGGHFNHGYSVDDGIPRDRSFRNMADVLEAARMLGIA